MDGRVDAARTAAVLASSGAAVIALQELDRGLPRSGHVDQPRRLGDRLGMTVRFHPTMSFGGGEYGIALLGPYPAEVDAIELPRARPDDEPRAALWGRWEGITFVCTHLTLDRAGRALQTAELARLCHDLEPPVVLLGDLNQTRRGLRPLAEVGLRPDRRRHLTHSSTRPRHQIDWALAGRGARVARSWTLWTRASDHLPLVAEVEASQGA
jgi:endonuclease/exonuclease/phosphatase family metal-dependent hydrolase